ncbi:methionine aminotransferase [Advenella faeciporci]|uniref:Methionine aminotransferase n=1 Tax=Advenella faeciporci TaxID=797535 RepID=A0A918JRI7_9BURK|nr:methionine aminotransferase [Advenella faeciporci]GGW95849.1 methionine aminotransferase [Advenella faeciporci]
MQIKSKFASSGSSIFSVTDDLLTQYDAINLAHGTPDFPFSQELLENAHEAMQAEGSQQAPWAGLMALREKIAEKISFLYTHSYHPDTEVTVMPSAKEAVFASIAAVVQAGDEVIYFEPSFDSYAAMISLQGAIPVAIRLEAPHFTPDWNQVKAKMNAKTRMIIINSPHNPTASVLSEADVQALQDLVKDSPVIILSDEVYEHLVFDGDVHRSMSAYPDLAARSIVVTSFSKVFKVSGWHVAYCVAPAILTREIRKVQQYVMFPADTPMQYALAAIMEQPNHYLTLSTIYQEKRDLLAHGLKSSRFELLPSRGGYFMLAGFGHFSDLSDVEMVRKLIVDHGVATLPLSAFYSDGTDQAVIRLTFSKDDETLEEGARRLCEV